MLLLEVSNCLYLEYLLFCMEKKVHPSFSVSNGVKKGGILSPILFNYFYIDDVSDSLNSSNIVGRIGKISLNHLCYADDLC